MNGEGMFLNFRGTIVPNEGTAISEGMYFIMINNVIFLYLSVHLSLIEY